MGRHHHVADLGPFQLLDAAASCDEAGREITLAVVNRDRDREQPRRSRWPGRTWQARSMAGR